ncbi:hypothetical protein HK099_005110 [Clydaea vesicula]|uniref:Uncharacterized protein n=1 Tax=Clydaea vesicula TaxID=447962 RepID=A0AAD5U1E7_9FUNG|nr:hypothetical protein HK099_005110 [Clydaea vesicula]KAJ3397104.1 hypothetical protein HDU92_000804 [Lobulomyces angularis]
MKNLKLQNTILITIFTAIFLVTCYHYFLENLDYVDYLKQIHTVETENKNSKTQLNKFEEISSKLTPIFKSNYISNDGSVEFKRKNDGTVDLTGASNDVVDAYSKLKFFYNIEKFEKKIYSQYGDDGAIEYIFSNLGTTNKFYVEFGTENAQECNTRALWEYYGWNGILMDGDGVSLDERKIYNHFITRENIVELFKKYNVPKDLDLLSIDINYNDWFIFETILEAGYTPMLIIVEMNRNFNADQSFTVRYNKDYSLKCCNYHFGFSILAGSRLANRFGYHLIYEEKQGVNSYYINVHYVKTWLKKVFDIDLTLFQVKSLLPTFEYIFRPSVAIHTSSLNQFQTDFQRGKSEGLWWEVKEDGTVDEKN